MKKYPFFVVFLVMFLFLSESNPKLAQAIQGIEYSQKYVLNEVLVKFKKDVLAEIVQQSIDYLQGKVVTYLGQELSAYERVPSLFSHRSFTGDPDLLLIKVPEYLGIERAMSLLRANPNVEYAEKNIVLHPLTSDPYYYQQWSLQNTGAKGIPDADIDAPEAWAISTGSPDIIVAVIDVGIDDSHPDLESNIWINPGEWGPDGEGGDKSNNDKDDDNNGYADDYRGWHWGWGLQEEVRNDPNPIQSEHGTVIAGIIGAVWNDIGIKGINQNVKIMNLNAENPYGVTTTSDMVNAIDYAIENGASIISCSLGASESDWEGNIESFEQAIVRAKNKGVLFVSACGNTDVGWDNLEVLWHNIYPGCFPEENIINVLTTNYYDELDITSCWGFSKVDIGAPGTQIFSTVVHS